MNATDNIIELKHITKSYVSGVNVIDDFNLSIKKGEFVTFLGPSGCGKTTILRMIGGFELPTSGQILLGGKDISKLPPNARPVNTVFQRYALFPHMNIYDNIAFGLKLKDLTKEEIDRKVQRVLEVVDLEGFEKRKVSTLSGGQQQRIAIARAIVNEPQILLLDEPLGALDFKMRKEMQLELKEMHRELGITFIFVTHDQEEALTMSDRIVVLAEGRIQQAGTPEDIYNEPSNAFVADFIGESNIFEGSMTGKLKATFCDTEFECVDDYPLGTKINAVVRPEDVELTEYGQGMLDGEVISSIFKGIFYDVAVQAGKNEISVQCMKPIKSGTKVGMKIIPDNIHIMPCDMTINHFEGVMDGEMSIHIAEAVLKPDIKRIFQDVIVENGRLYSEDDGELINTDGIKIEVSFDQKDAVLSDNADEGLVRGDIISIIYMGDHYSYIVQSEHEIDYYVNDDYLWNIGDHVSVIIPEEKINYKLL